MARLTLTFAFFTFFLLAQLAECGFLPGGGGGGDIIIAKNVQQQQQQQQQGGSGDSEQQQQQQQQQGGNGEGGQQQQQQQQQGEGDGWQQQEQQQSGGWGDIGGMSSMMTSCMKMLPKFMSIFYDCMPILKKLTTKMFPKGWYHCCAGLFKIMMVMLEKCGGGLGLGKFDGLSHLKGLSQFQQQAQSMGSMFG